MAALPLVGAQFVSLPPGGLMTPVGPVASLRRSLVGLVAPVALRATPAGRAARTDRVARAGSAGPPSEGLYWEDLDGDTAAAIPILAARQRHERVC